MMATETIDRSPPTAPAPSRYCRDDLFGWVEDQVALLEAGRLLEADAKNVAEGYEDARDDAQQETGLSAKVFSAACPDDLDMIVTRVVEFEGVRSPEN